MTGTETNSVIDFESKLAPGTKVLARWTNSYSYYAAPATVTKVNGKSVLVAIDESILGAKGNTIYPAGNKIKCPLFFGDTWSANNRVEPAGGYGG